MYSTGQDDPVGGYGRVEQPVAETGWSTASIVRVVTSPPGILRVVTFFCAMISFSAMADASCGKGCKKWSSFSEWEYLVGIGVLVWLYTAFMLVASIVDLHTKFSALSDLELGLDGLFSFLYFVAGIAAASRCSTGVNGSSTTYCSSDVYGSKPRAAAAFAFLATFALMGSTFFTHQRNKALNDRQGGSAGGAPATTYY